ncbi:MAG TPA: inosine/xanthosine triphosphatase [Acidobacteriota bacterium]|nr:inosine/xanthosine triphosphatase [Acidobacteriota bacterium]
MMRVLIGSANPVKRASVEEAFGLFFDELEVQGRAVPSGVPDQPVNDETLIGARNRATALRSVRDVPDVDYFVGIEGGIVEQAGRVFAFGGMCVTDRHGREALGSSPHFELPPEVARQVLAGRELGIVMDELTGQHNSKHKGGAIGFLTRGVMDRRALYVAGLVVTLVPFLNQAVYFGDGDSLPSAGGL